MSELHKISGCENANREADVIFIHGLGGDAYKTWRNSNQFFWPVWLGKEFPEVGVWSLDYPASPSRWVSAGWLLKRQSDAGRTMALPDRALQVLDRMVQCGLGERPILFVCHSLGGLLAKQILRNSFDATDARKRQVFTQTSALLFLATPHSGSELASLFNAFSLVFGTTVSIEELRAHDAHLRELYNWYRNHAPGLGIQTVTYYEQRPVKVGLSIVNPTSAHPGVGADPVPLDEDHISIARPESGTAQVCSSVCDLLRNTVLAQRLAPSVEQPQNVLPHELPKSQELVIKREPSILSGSATRRVPHELPPAVEQFFGRQTELNKLIDRLQNRKNTIVYGGPGLGKTALAAEAVRKVVGESPELLAASPYSDGVVFLNLYTFHGNAEQVWNTFANKLAGPEYMPSLRARERAEEACRKLRILVIIEGGEEADGKAGRCSITELRSVFSPENCWLLLTRLSTQVVPFMSVELKNALQPEDAANLLDALCQCRVTGTVRDRVLEMCDGHPLALTWSGNLLARGDETPEQRIKEWQEQLSKLSDPAERAHTLEWLFNRSARGLEKTERLALEAAALLAQAPFPLSAIELALGEKSYDYKGHFRSVMNVLVQCAFLQWLSVPVDFLQFTHVLGYRFARKESASDPKLRVALGFWLQGYLKVMLESTTREEQELADALLHVAALLRTDKDQQLWFPLAHYVLHDAFKSFMDLNRLDLAKLCLRAVEDWFKLFSEEKLLEPDWSRERDVLQNQQNSVRTQNDIMGVLSTDKGSQETIKNFAIKPITSSDSMAALPFTGSNCQRHESVGQKKVRRAIFWLLASLYELQGNRSEALHYAERILDIDLRLVNLDSTNVVWQGDLAISRALAERLKSKAQNE